jgi:type IX secretion system PorP/SprF family membrane protein
MKSILCFFILLPLAFSSSAQDVTFTQKTGNINHFNPALVGAQSDFGVQANYNNQWPPLQSNPITYSLLTNYNLKSGLGFGLEVKSESVGSTRSDALKANINHACSKNGFELRSGVNIGVLQNSIDVTKLNFRDPNDPILNEIKKHNPKRGVSLDIGAAAYYKGFLLGLGVQQVNQPNTSVIEIPGSELPSRFVANLGYHKKLKTFDLATLITYQQQGRYSVLETQIYGQYKFAKLGIGHRQVFGTYGNTDLFSSSLGLQFTKFSVGYSFENFLNSNTASTFGGIHQASAAWYIKGLSKEKGMSRLMNVLM